MIPLCLCNTAITLNVRKLLVTRDRGGGVVGDKGDCDNNRGDQASALKALTVLTVLLPRCPLSHLLWGCTSI